MWVSAEGWVLVTASKLGGESLTTNTHTSAQSPVGEGREHIPTLNIPSLSSPEPEAQGLVVGAMVISSPSRPGSGSPPPGKGKVGV